LVLTRWPVAAAATTALIGFWPQLFGGTAAERAQIVRLEALVVWTESLRDTIAAHASLEQAIPASTAHCPTVIRPALTRLAGQIQARAPLDVALLGLAAELDDPSADLVCASLILNVRRRGDRLADVLTGLAVAAREELDLRRRISAGRAGLRRGVQIVVAMTLAFAAFLIVFGGAYVRPYDGLAGQAALLVVVGMFATGFAWLRRLSAADPAEAYLARPGRPAWANPADVRLVTGLTGLSAQADGVRAEPGVVR
jgi:tight adherence protein B